MTTLITGPKPVRTATGASRSTASLGWRSQVRGWASNRVNCSRSRLRRYGNRPRHYSSNSGRPKRLREVSSATPPRARLRLKRPMSPSPKNASD